MVMMVVAVLGGGRFQGLLLYPLGVSILARLCSAAVSPLDVLLVAAVLVGMSVQAAIGFGFAFFVAPAAFAPSRPSRR